MDRKASVYRWVPEMFPDKWIFYDPDGKDWRKGFVWRSHGDWVAVFRNDSVLLCQFRSCNWGTSWTWYHLQRHQARKCRYGLKGILEDHRFGNCEKTWFIFRVSLIHNRRNPSLHGALGHWGKGLQFWGRYLVNGSTAIRNGMRLVSFRIESWVTNSDIQWNHQAKYSHKFSKRVKGCRFKRIYLPAVGKGPFNSNDRQL